MSSSNSVKIIHVDDHKLFRMGVRNILSPVQNIEYLGEAGNGQELLQMLETMRPDVIILNIQMPVMDGTVTLPIIKEKYPHIKVIMLSMHNDAKMVRKMIELGANAYLTKSAEKEELIEAVFTCKYSWFYVNKTVVNAFSNAYP